jgi:hypothetical protein
MNGFSYDPEQKKITITDNTSIVIWENVEKDVAIEAGKLYNASIPESYQTEINKGIKIAKYVIDKKKLKEFIDEK